MQRSPAGLPDYSLLVTIPHSGENIPPQATWLKTLPEEILMCDVDRFVDVLYEPALQKLQIPSAKTEWHRYAGDLNRGPEDVDAGTVFGNLTAAGTHRRGFLWGITTLNQSLLPAPVSSAVHQELVQLIYEPFHRSVRKLY
jgi:N-formylglutamate deformylase